MKQTFIIIIGILVLLTILYFVFSMNKSVENFDVSPVYYCQNCEGKTFGQCQNCLSCTWIIDPNTQQGRCIKGDPYHFSYVNYENRPIYDYQRDPFYTSPYYAMITC